MNRFDNRLTPDRHNWTTALLTGLPVDIWSGAKEPEGTGPDNRLALKFLTFEIAVSPPRVEA